MEGIPIDRDLAVANPEEAPEVDDRSTHLPALIDDHVDDPPHTTTIRFDRITLSTPHFEGTRNHGSQIGPGTEISRSMTGWVARHATA
jgi:hypothetical protein